MRSDTNLNKRFRAEGVDVREYGAMPGVLDTNTEVDGQRVLRSHSFSGNEKNSVFYNRHGKQFSDISGVSGLDSIADGRAFAYFDYDRDGRTDIVLTNTNNPQLQLFRNTVDGVGNSICIRLIGGNTAAEPSDAWSPRDGYGARVLISAGEMELTRELRCGDGFAAQNSRVMTVGIGGNEAARVEVLWPSGKRGVVEGVPAGSSLTVHENPAEEPAVPVPMVAAKLPAPVPEKPAETLDLDLPTDRAPVTMVVNMATWCAVCRGEIPHLQRLADDAGDRVTFFGMPVDPSETEAEFAAYREGAAPPYNILEDTGAARREKMEALLRSRFGETPLPSTVLLDRDNRVLGVFKGTPTLSELRGTR